MKPEELAAKVKSGTAPVIVDVRTAVEFKLGHIQGAINAPAWKILLRIVALPKNRKTEMVVLCQIGQRAMVAKKLLEVLGYSNLELLDGHMSAWRNLGLPQVK